TLQAPEERWGGIQRALLTTDFELSNVEYIQFWVMDPFNEDSQNDTGGELYLNLGSISEDLLNDGQLAFENGLPSANQPAPIQESTWGQVADPSTFNVVNAFDNSTGDYSLQDVGLDGLNSQEEQEFFGDWLTGLQDDLEPEAYDAYRADPSADDFRYFRDPVAQANEENVLERYRFFNGYEGNSSTAQPEGYPIASTTLPNTEDINEDLTLSAIESYFQYRIPLRPGDLTEANIGRNYLSDVLLASTTMPNGETKEVKWLQFKVPIRDFEQRVGGISDFRSIRFMRVFMKGWRQPVTLRFARLELIRGEWRKFEESLAGPQEIEPDDPSDTQFAISAVNVEENGYRQPINYVVPPGIIREINVATANQAQLNEQSLQLEICGLEDGDARAAYRNINFDMRMYKRLRMFVHGEAFRSDEPLETGDLSVFVRLGSDFVDNYYEYEIPLTVTPWGVTEETEIWPVANEVD
ncbi:MAG: cell surface protein SprA, partial [Bacteroidota bacterium]|nr:cell surface protein SprA [Bacteroidota bacterium]